MTDIIFEFDPHRGGFALCFGKLSRQRDVAAFDRLIEIYTNEQDKIIAIESFWDHGGLPLCGFENGFENKYPQGDFLVKGDELHINQFHLKQTEKTLQLWFGIDRELDLNQGLHHQSDERYDIDVWFSPEKGRGGWNRSGQHRKCHPLASIKVDMSRTVAMLPITSIRLSAEDFK